MSRASAAAVLNAVPAAEAILIKERERGPRPHLVPTFRGANLEAQTITQHEWILSGPADTGKTFSETWRLDSLVRETPRGSFAIVRKVRADFNSTVRKRWEATIRVRGGVEIRGGDSPSKYVYANGAEVHVLGFDRDSSVLSGEFDGIYVNQVEELALGEWETLSSRVTGRGAVTKTPMAFGDCNPGPPKHWILERSQTGPLRLLYSTHKDNPEIYDTEGNLTPEGALRLAPLQSLTGIRRERYYLGNWKAAEGTVYDFERAVHLVPRASMPACSRYIVAIDFGLTNPFVAQLWSIDGDGRMYLDREIYMTGRIVEDHAKSIKAMCAGKSIEAYVADPADREGRETLRRHGVSTVPALNAISDGIQAVQARMGNVLTGVAPRIFFVESALIERDESLVTAHKPVCTLDEIESYVWPKDASGRARKEEPVKENDHGMDAMRYAVKYVDRANVDPIVTVVTRHGSPSRMRL